MKHDMTVTADESLTFYADNTGTRTADISSDAAPRQHAPVPTQLQPVHFDSADRLTEMSAATKPHVNGKTQIICVHFSCFCFCLVCGR